MSRNIFRLALALSACALVFASSGCDTVTGPTGASLAGVWSSAGGDGFTVTPTSFSYQYGGTEQFAGEIANAPDLSGESGYIVMRVTYRVTDTYPEVGSYYAVHWKNFSGDGVQEASAYKTGGEHNSGMDTLSAALGEYTVANGYFGYYGEYLRDE